MAKIVSGARVIWIEADPVFGGSRSQVQFPAELSGFFGLPRNPQRYTPRFAEGLYSPHSSSRRKKWTSTTTTYGVSIFPPPSRASADIGE